MTTEKFNYQIAGGKKIVMPRFNHVPMGIIRRLRKESEGDQLFGLLEQLVELGKMPEASLTALDNMDREEFAEVMQEWQKDAEVTYPES